MANKHSSKSKYKSKHKKEKSERHKKKHKKEKKYKHDSSESEESEKKETQEPAKREEWNFFDTILNSANVTAKSKSEKSTKRPMPEKFGQNVRELNPYWKDGGCGLPPNVSNTSFNRNIMNHRPSNEANSSKNYNSHVNTGKSKLGFLKPGEDSNICMKANTFQQNWRKKDARELETESREKFVEKEKTEQNISNSSKLLTSEELNKLAAKLMKAEIMGDEALVNKLKKELDAAKKLKEENSQQIEKEIVLVEKNMKKPYDGAQNYGGSKRQKVATHDFQGRVCYFPDDYNYSLKNLFEKEKTGVDDEIVIPSSKLAGKKPKQFEDIYLEVAASNKIQKKVEEKQHQRSLTEATIKHKALEKCKFCIDNKKKHLIISTGRSCYLCLPEEESLVPNHCLIVPLQHEISTLHLDEDVWNEMKTYQRVLTKMFLLQDQDVIFFENARCFKIHPHCFIQCVPLDKEIGELAPIYFQKAISESETEWVTNKKVVDFRNRDLRKSIPKGLPYFAVSFGMDGGFAHIIEDEYLFKRNFAQEVIGGMMDLDHKKWRKPQSEDFKTQRQKVLGFLKLWRKHEFNENITDTDSSSSE